MDEQEIMSPRRPYLLRALYDWLLDNELTPYLLVNVTLPGVQVPPQFANDEQIVLNIAPPVVDSLMLGDDEVRFGARFSGKAWRLSIPLYAVMAIYAKENRAGMMFEQEPAYAEKIRQYDEGQPGFQIDESKDLDDEPPRPPTGRPQLKLVK